MADMDRAVEDEFLKTIMLQDVPSGYEPMIMALEYSGVEIISSLIKLKLLQDNR